MTSVRDASFDLFRAHGMTTMFGNPGSTELPMLQDFPDDFTYVLGLQEAVVVGMADGYAQASGGPALVNLHTAPGVGNAMGAIFNAQANHSPLVITAGQQVRSLMTLQANLTNRDATRMPHPLVKWSYEPARAEDVPLALARATHLATLPPKGPAFVSIPMDDWDAEVDDGRRRRGDQAQDRRPRGRRARGGRRARAAPGAASNPVLIAGPDIDASGAWDAAVALAERQNLPVFATPRPGGGRIGFPEGHPNFRGVLPPAIGPVSETLKGRDLILVVGSSVFPYYPNLPGPLLPEGAELVEITSDPDEAARAPMGDAIVADVKLTLEALLAEVGESDRDAGESLPEPDRRARVRPDHRHQRRCTRCAASSPTTGSSSWRRRRRRCRCATSCGCRSRAATTSAPAAGSASGSRRRSASSSPSPSARSSASSARARCSTRSPPSGAPSPTTCRSPSASCATTSTRSSSGSRRSRASRARPGSTCRRSTAPRSPRATASTPRKVEGAEELREALGDRDRLGRPELVEVGVAPGMWLF